MQRRRVSHRVATYLCEVEALELLTKQGQRKRGVCVSHEFYVWEVEGNLRGVLSVGARISSLH